LEVKRRGFITLLGGAAAAWSLAARAQQTKTVRRVGLLSAFTRDPESQGAVNAFKQTLESLGWEDGKDVRFDERWAQGDASRVRSLAGELVAAAPDVILAAATPALVALREQTRTIPLVFVNVSDPVDGGFVESMARPGGNVTGFTSFEYAIGGKWLELLKEVAPSLASVLVVLNQENYTSRALLHTVEAVAPAAGVQVRAARVRNGADIESALKAFGHAPNGGVIVMPDPVMNPHRERIAASAVSNHLPMIHAFRFFAAAGSLMSYGTDNANLYRQAATYVDRILNGANVAELPVQNPTKYRLIINLKTAKALGLTVPPNLLARADEVIE
jgi:putative ABC transport system substrate-binding protein